MNATLRRFAAVLIGTGAAAVVLLGFADMASAKTVAGGTSHATQAFLPNAVVYTSTASQGCDPGYFAGDLGATLSGAITCTPYATDFDASATTLMITEPHAACPTGYQRGLAGDGIVTPYYTGCIPWAAMGSATAHNYQADKSVGCAPGYAPSSDPGMSVVACFVTPWDVAQPGECAGAPALDANDNYVPCVFDANGNPVLDRPKSLHVSTSVVGSATTTNVLHARVGSVPAGASVRYQWKIDGRNIVGANGSSLRVPGSTGSHVWVTTTVSAKGYSTKTVQSGARVIRANTMRASHGVGLSGVSRVGRHLVAHIGRFTAAGSGVKLAGLHVQVTWVDHSGRALGGAHRAYLHLGKSLRGRVLRARIVVSKAGFKSWVGYTRYSRVH